MQLYLLYMGSSTLHILYFWTLFKIPRLKQEYSNITSQYIASLLEFVLENRNLFTTNRDTHGLTTHNCFDLHLPQVNLTRVQRGVLYSGCRVFNKLPVRIKSLSENPRHFKKKTEEISYGPISL